MGERKRSLFARAGTFLRFVSQQRRALKAMSAGLQQPQADAALRLTGGESDWTTTGYRVRRGETFRLTAKGHVWLARALALALEPRSTVYMRIGGGRIRKIIADDGVYEAWDDGEIEVLSKGLSEFADETGALLPGKRAPQAPGISIVVTASSDPVTSTGAPDGWSYLWRLGDGQIYSGARDDLKVSTLGDVGILQSDVDVPLTPDTVLSWDWLVEKLPSALPEDLAFTHDYLSIAVEFENGRDLTYMWSAALPHDHVFRCPLNWWCERETHWVLRSGVEGLGEWRSERRVVAEDYRAALGEPLPARIVRVWLIANSAFQRSPGSARFAKIAVG